MKIKLGRHYLADLYLCQNKLWEDPLQLATEIAKALAVNISMGKFGPRTSVILISVIRSYFYFIQCFRNRDF